MNALSGHAKLSGGQVMLDGRDVTGLSVHKRTRIGLGRSFQITKIFAGMSVLENLQLAAFAHLYRLQPFWLPAGRFPAHQTNQMRQIRPEPAGISEGLTAPQKVDN